MQLLHGVPENEKKNIMFASKYTSLLRYLYILSANMNKAIANNNFKETSS